MAWMKLDDKFHSSRKVNSIPKRHRFQAVGLWAIAGSWVAGEETDGFVPDYMIEQWAPTAATVNALVAAGLWQPTDGGYQFCSWLEYNPSKAQTKAEREASAARMKASRERRKAQSQTNSRDSDLEQTTSRGRTEVEQRSDGPHSDHEQRSDSADTNRESSGVGQNTPGQHAATRNVAAQHPDTLHRNTPAVLQRPDPTRPDPTPSLSPNGDRALSDDDRPHGRAVPASGWKVVRDTIPDTHPQAVRSDLAIRAGALLHSGTPEADVRDALSLWLAKPHAGSGLLPSLVSEVVKSRTTPTASNRPSTTDARVAAAQALKAELGIDTIDLPELEA